MDLPFDFPNERDQFVDRAFLPQQDFVADQNGANVPVRPGELGHQVHLLAVTAFRVADPGPENHVESRDPRRSPERGQVRRKRSTSATHRDTPRSVRDLVRSDPPGRARRPSDSPACDTGCTTDTGWDARHPPVRQNRAKRAKSQHERQPQPGLPRKPASSFALKKTSHVVDENIQTRETTERSLRFHPAAFAPRHRRVLRLPRQAPGIGPRRDPSNSDRHAWRDHRPGPARPPRPHTQRPSPDAPADTRTVHRTD